MDSITQSRIKLLHPALRDETTNLINQANAELRIHSQVRVTETFRTFDEENGLYAQGRTIPGKKVTNTKGGQSFHNYGLALDFCLIIDDNQVSWDTKKDWNGDKISDWMQVVNIFIKSGWEWGGSWKFTDNPHLQKTFGLDWKILLDKYTKNDFIKGTKYVNL